MLTWVIGIIGLGVMVFVHELGHFVAAKANGIGVETFSLGWGPRLVGFRRGGTMYQLSWLPIGGYCKMKGEMVPGIAGGGDRGPAADGPAAPPPGSFLAAAGWRRIIVFVAGPLSNILFAFLIFTAIWWVGFTYRSADTRIVVAEDASSFGVAEFPARTAGLRTGDRITAVNGAPVASFSDLSQLIVSSPGRALHLTVEREEDGGSRTLALDVTPLLDRSTGAGRIGVLSWIDPVAGAVAAGGPAALAGLRAGDVLVSVDGTPVATAWDVEAALAGKPSQAVVGYTRGGASGSATVVFAYEGAAATADLGIDWLVPAHRSPRMGIVSAARQSLRETWDTVTGTVKGFALLFQGVKLRNALAGPLRITETIGAAAVQGFAEDVGTGVSYFLRIVSLLSVILFLMNLLPLPALDGGQVILVLIEMVRGRPVNPRLAWQIQLVGFTLLLALFLLATVNDAQNLLGR